MTAAITNFFHTVFGDNVWLATILIAIIPLIELKGAIPFAMSVAFWGERALNAWSALAFAYLGSIIIVPLLALIFRPIYHWLKTKKFFNRIMDFLVGGVATKSDQMAADPTVQAKSTTRRLWLKIMAVAVFVAFPVPLTGVWTGTCFAVLLGLNFWQTCVTVMVGNAVCGLIVAGVCSVFPQATNILLYVFLALVLVAVLVKVIMHIIKQKRTATVAPTGTVTGGEPTVKE